MTFEVLMGTDIIFVASHKVQSAYGTRLANADFQTTVGKRLLLNTATLGDVRPSRSPGTPRAGSRTEHPIANVEKVTGHDSSLSLAMDCDSMSLGLFLAHIFQDCDSTQEGATTHYTHVMQCTDPLAVSGSRVSLVTSAYLDAGNSEAGRLQRILQDLAVTGVTISGRGKDIVSQAVDMIGSGREVTDQAITPSSLADVQEFANDGVKLEYGNKGGSLTDISDRLDTWSLRFNKQLASDQGYYPGSGLYRGRLWFIRRSFSIELGIYVNRANRDLIDDMKNRTEKEIKVTIDSGYLREHRQQPTIR
jgi:hypothetical protein